MKIKKIPFCLVMHAPLLLGASAVSAQEIVNYVHTDALGSPIAISDSSGAVIERTGYAPYGEVIGPRMSAAPGFTGHVEDVSTGLTYMQQRYYDSSLGGFLSVDPVSAYENAVSAFSRYRYGNGNPLRFVDPDGRTGCTGTNITGTCLAGGVAGMMRSATGVTATEVAAARDNPVRFVKALNERKNSHATEGASSAYFARAALPVTIGSGREVAADIVHFSFNGKPYSVLNFVLGPAGAGDGSGSVEILPYDGWGTRVAIAHTHPVNNNFSGLPARITSSGGFANRGGDLQLLFASGVNGYLATPNGTILKFDYMGLRAAMGSGVTNVDAAKFVSRMP